MRNGPKINAAMKAWVRRWVRETMTKLGYPELGDQIKIIFRPMTHKIGLSEWQIHRKVSTGRKVCVTGLTIYFSADLWPHIGRDERYETVVHECCHLVDALENDNNHEEPHGDTWLELMTRLGCAGEPLLNVEQINVPYDVLCDMLQTCNICKETGHVATTCEKRDIELENKLNKLLSNE